MIKNLFLLALIITAIGCGKKTKCYYDYEYKHNGYTYVEHKRLICEDR